MLLYVYKYWSTSHYYGIILVKQNSTKLLLIKNHRYVLGPSQHCPEPLYKHCLRSDSKKRGEIRVLLGQRKERLLMRLYRTDVGTVNGARLTIFGLRGRKRRSSVGHGTVPGTIRYRPPPTITGSTGHTTGVSLITRVKFI
jgi:hypothetical protein